MWKANGKGMNVGVTTFQKHLIIPRKDGCTTRMEVEYENKNNACSTGKIVEL